MWEKWAFIAAAAGITCLMRATVGTFTQPRSRLRQTHLRRVRADSREADSTGDSTRQVSLTSLTTAGSPLTASMLRDIEGHGRTEVDQSWVTCYSAARHRPPFFDPRNGPLARESVRGPPKAELNS